MSKKVAPVELTILALPTVAPIGFDPMSIPRLRTITSTAQRRAGKGIKTKRTPEGFEDSSSASIEKAVRRILWLLYAGKTIPSEPLTTQAA